jgi:hypothetical protein
MPRLKPGHRIASNFYGMVFGGILTVEMLKIVFGAFQSMTSQVVVDTSAPERQTPPLL